MFYVAAAVAVVVGFGLLIFQLCLLVIVKLMMVGDEGVLHSLS